MEDSLTDDDIEFLEMDDISGVEEVNPQTAATLDALRDLALFGELPRTTLLSLAEQASVLQRPAGTEVMRAGTTADALYAIVRGSVAVEVAGVAKAEPVLLGVGEIFGEACVLSDEPRHATVRAQGEVVLLALSKKSVDWVVAQHPEVGDALLEMLMRRLIVNLMRTSPVFTMLETRMRSELAQLFETRKAPPGTVLIEEGAVADGMYIPLTGMLELSARGSAKRVRAGSVVGQGSLLSHSPSRYAVATVGDCVLLRLPAARFMDLITQYPPVLELLASRSLIAAE